MKKRTILWFVLLMLLFVALDQGVKLAVDHFFVEPEEIWDISNPHIHPLLHDKDAQTFTALAEKTHVNYYLWLVLYALGVNAVPFLLLGSFWLVDRFFFWDMEEKRKRFPKLTILAAAMFTSGGICSMFFDNIFWGGSLDFICFPRIEQVPVADHFHETVYHTILDFKDLYLWVGATLIAVRIILWLISFIKNEKALTEKCKHPIRNVKSMFGK